jgi:hypothetical protein
METNPRSLQSNPSWFFHNRHSCLLKNKSLGALAPRKQTWGSSVLHVGPLASNTEAPQCFIHKI